MLYNLNRTFGKDGAENFKKKMEECSLYIPKVIEQNKVVLTAMKEAYLPTYLLRRVVYDDMSFNIDRYASDLKFIYVQKQLEENKEKLDTIREACRSLVWEFTSENIGEKTDDVLRHIKNKMSAVTDKKQFTDLIYAHLRPIIDKELDNL